MPTCIPAHWCRRLLVLLVVAITAAGSKAANAQNTSDVGDACQLTKSVEACASMAKAWKPGGSAGLYVALAISKATPKAGVAHGQTSKSAAEQLALANCKAAGANDCSIAQSQENTCLGFATSVTKTATYTKTDVGAGADPDRTKAGNFALQGCRETGGQQCEVRVSACSSDNPAYPSRLPLPAGGKAGSVDSNWVGTWQIDINGQNGGRWIWQISVNGTYELHSEAFDGTPANVGTFSASGGRYTLHATNIDWDDAGTYFNQAPGTMVATGKLGTGTWHKIAGEDE